MPFNLLANVRTATAFLPSTSISSYNKLIIRCIFRLFNGRQHHAAAFKGHKASATRQRTIMYRIGHIAYGMVVIICFLTSSISERPYTMPTKIDLMNAVVRIGIRIIGASDKG